MGKHDKAAYLEMALQNSPGDVHMAATSWGLQEHPHHLTAASCLGLQTDKALYKQQPTQAEV